MNDMNFGAIEQEQKESDFEIGALATSEPIPESYMTPYAGIVYHQHKTPSCGAHAGTYIKNIQDSKEYSPAYLWKRIKQIDGFPPEDGTSMIAIFKALQKWGVCELSLLPNNTLDSTEVYTDPSVLTPKMDINAYDARIGAYAFQWNPTFDDIKRAIYEHKVVTMLLRVGSEWWTPDWAGKDILPLKTNQPISSGHFVVATGYDKSLIYFQNEWGETWGYNGKGNFGSNYVPRCVQIGTCFDLVEKAPYVFNRLLKYGMTGTDVGMLQQLLKQKGYFPADQAITSNFLGKTFLAVEKFQQANHLKVDGVVGTQTVAALLK